MQPKKCVYCKDPFHATRPFVNNSNPRCTHSLHESCFKRMQAAGQRSGKMFVKCPGPHPDCELGILFVPQQ
jgi:hypothetical protein